jgi:hypothetical protein
MATDSAYADLIQRLGFVADPFAKTNADEEERLDAYFIQPPFYNAVYGDPGSPKSTVVFAPRGGGKTALKRKIEIASMGADFLCITYNTFPTERLSIADINSAYHFVNLLRLVLIAVIGECNEHGVDRLSKTDRHFLYLFAKIYLSGIDQSELRDSIKAVKNLSDKARDWWNKFTGPVGLLLNAMLTKLGFGVAEVKKFEQEGGSLGAYHEQFRVLRDIAEKFGKRAIYILVDRVDELLMTGSGSSSYQFIAPLLTDLHLLELRGFGFKFFLWDMLLDEYRASGRPDRVKYHSLEWSHVQLKRMISERLKAYSDSGITSLTQLLGPQTSITVDRLVIYYALGSPRTIIRICKEIVDQQSEIDAAARVLSVEAVYRGIEVFAGNFAGETVDAAILRDLKKIRRANFTVKHVYSNVFKFTQQAGIAKVKQWQDAGIVERVGSIKETAKSKPSNVFALTNPLVGKHLWNDLSALDFCERKLRVCSECGALLIRDWDERRETVCHRCDSSQKIPAEDIPAA